MSEKWLPIPDAETEEFWHGLARGVLLVRSCNSCSRLHYYPRSFCPFCWSSDVAWREMSGRGTVYATTIVRQHGLSPFKERAPYNISLVDLDEGPRLLTNVVGCAPEDVHIGDTVVLEPDVHDDIGLPLFRRA